MTRIRIELDLDDEYADDEHPAGLSAEGDERLGDMLGQFGENIVITRV